MEQRINAAAGEKAVTFITRDMLLVYELCRDYYVAPRQIVCSLADIAPTFQYHRHRRDYDALVINTAEFPSLDDNEPPDFAPVIKLGSEHGVLPLNASAEEVAQALGAKRRPRPGSLVVVVLSPDVGGCGKTTLAMNMARVATADGRTLLIEADLDGRLRYLLPAKIPPQAPGVYEACQTAGEMWSLAPYVQRVRDIDVLLAPFGPHERLAATVNTESLAHLVQQSRTEYDVTIIEFAAIPYGSNLALIHADAIVVATKDSPGMAENLDKILLRLRRLPGVVERMGLAVISRDGDAGRLGSSKLPVFGIIPFDPSVDEIHDDREIVVDQPKRSPKVAQAYRDVYARVRAAARPAIIRQGRTDPTGRQAA